MEAPTVIPDKGLWEQAMRSRLDSFPRATERMVREAVRLKLKLQWRPKDAADLLEEAADTEWSQSKRKDMWVGHGKAIKKRILKYARVSMTLPCVLNYGHGVTGFKASSVGFGSHYSFWCPHASLLKCLLWPIVYRRCVTWFCASVIFYSSPQLRIVLSLRGASEVLFSE